MQLVTTVSKAICIFHIKSSPTEHSFLFDQKLVPSYLITNIYRSYSRILLTKAALSGDLACKSTRQSDYLCKNSTEELYNQNYALQKVFIRHCRNLVTIQYLKE